ncbi:oligosaccharyltransferase complex subunit epsilon [Tilletia horrida]|uniref:Dolichyl-diphosphooligosaccharide--protein glycosyltransferase subunit OST2 n=1 Tax=Tilletia horrida TaxID=155126 RepID=A0AAN6GGZ9_9BASI|nr:oligosaccharyltransferase complex subunit epsilon [Tilletia horrida]KAK0529138.1 oligosaccharyltransferase complex subunit epsilon [Tilletia horrida]KAK0536713.1 oligosaccharyltransferase complex subunit epsilon [Tilletia horrida]
MPSKNRGQKQQAATAAAPAEPSPAPAQATSSATATVPTPALASAVSAPRTSSLPASASNQNVFSTLVSSYNDSTPAHLKLIDGFLVFLVLTGVIQFAYCVAVTNFPFNSFIAGFASTVGQFVLAASLRIQANTANTSDFPKVSPERAFADFLFGSIILHFFVINFLG